MSFYDDNNVDTWLQIAITDETDLDALCRLFVAEEVQKALEMEADGSSDAVPATFSEWKDQLGEELEFQNDQGEWLHDRNYGAVAGRCDALLPYFLENYEPIRDRVIWD